MAMELFGIDVSLHADDTPVAEKDKPAVKTREKMKVVERFETDKNLRLDVSPKRRGRFGPEIVAEPRENITVEPETASDFEKGEV